MVELLALCMLCSTGPQPAKAGMLEMGMPRISCCSVIFSQRRSCTNARMCCLSALRAGPWPSNTCVLFMVSAGLLLEGSCMSA